MKNTFRTIQEEIKYAIIGSINHLKKYMSFEGVPYTKNTEQTNQYEQYVVDLKKRVEEAMKENGNEMPDGPFQNKINGWWFDDQEIKQANEQGRMLTLDLDIGKKCSLDCDFCFANTHCENGTEYEDYTQKTTERVKKLLTEASKLGVKSIKIVGAGEPTMFPGLIEVLEHAKNLEITPIIFTGGHILGNDKLAKKYHREYGITSGLELAKKLSDLGCSFVVKFLSLNPELQEKLVRKRSLNDEKVKNSGLPFVKDRDNGLINLIKLGLNKNQPTRLGIDALLIKENYKEAVSLFSFFNKYNIFCVLNTVMDCGKTKFDLSTFDDSLYLLNPDIAKEIAANLYRYCKENNIPFGDRVSPYFTSPVCAQLNHGMFVGDNGQTRACPGGPEVGNYTGGNLEEIWDSTSMKNIRDGCSGCEGHECISRSGKTYPKDLEKEVLREL